METTHVARRHDVMDEPVPARSSVGLVRASSTTAPTSFGERIEPRDLSESPTLPRLEAASALAHNRLYDSLASGFTFDLSQLAGADALHAATAAYRVHWQHADTLPVCSAYRFKLGPHVGWLGLDGPAQAALFQERRFEQLPRELRYVLLADATHALVDSLMRTLRLSFEWSPPEADAPAFNFDAEQAAAFMLLPSTAGTSALHPGARGCLQFVEGGALNAVLPAVPFVGAPVDAPPPNTPPAALPRWMAALRLPVRFVLGSTQIRLHEVSGIRPGDIVSIEEWGSAGAGVLVTAELGGRQGRRLVALAEGSRITVQQTKDIAMNRDPHPHTAPAEHGDVAALPIDRLDALEVTLRFEVGDLDVSLGELRSIRGGHVFDLPQPLNRSPVRILAHGNVLGKGYLVAVGDRLGVRVSEFAPSEI